MLSDICVLPVVNVLVSKLSDMSVILLHMIDSKYKTGLGLLSGIFYKFDLHF
jgi:hypothetical protein